MSLALLCFIFVATLVESLNGVGIFSEKPKPMKGFEIPVPRLIPGTSESGGALRFDP
jgi:hypothetical protein